MYVRGRRREYQKLFFFSSTKVRSICIYFYVAVEITPCQAGVLNIPMQGIRTLHSLYRQAGRYSKSSLSYPLLQV